MRRPQIITIDGPAASGKSTLGYLLAQALGYTYFDTGVLYRAITALALSRGLTLAHEPTIAALAAEVDLAVVPPTVADGRQSTVLADGADITMQLRSIEVDRNVSQVAGYPSVRAALREQQRRIGQRGQVVMVGRDIGTVVMPDADFKVFLQASVAARAARRQVDLHQQGDALAHATVAADIERRDALDAPNTIQAADAWIMDTDNVSPEQEVALILDLIEQGRWRPMAVER